MNFEEKISVTCLAVLGFNNVVDLTSFLEVVLLTVSIVGGSLGLYWRYLKHKRENK